MPFATLLPSILPLVGNVLDRFFPNKEEKDFPLTDSTIKVAICGINAIGRGNNKSLLFFLRCFLNIERREKIVLPRDVFKISPVTSALNFCSPVQPRSLYLTL